MVNDAKKNEEKDKEIEARVQARNSLDHYIYEVTKQFKDKDTINEKLTEEEIADFKKALKRVRKWFKDSSEVAEREDIERHHKKFEADVTPFIVKAFGEDAVRGQNGVDELDDLDDL
jgi:molecular chaperone DnaK (HSP70)